MPSRSKKNHDEIERMVARTENRAIFYFAVLLIVATVIWGWLKP
jgi:hypothetical protein